MGTAYSLKEDEGEERALLAAARSGDHGAFERLVALHAPSVYRITASHLGIQEAEDAAQEVFTRVYLGLKGYKGEARLATWIFRIATNVSLTRSRRRRKREPAAPLVEQEIRSSGPAPEESLAVRERREAVRRAVEQLPEEQRAVVALRSEGLSFEEVAQVLGILRPTAESRMARAKERLKVLLDRYMRD